MDELGRNSAGEANELVSEGAVNSAAELRKRRSTRIVQAVPLVVTGVDALGRPFAERTSTLIINCHGCRYQSKHYVLKNMWVSLEVPHPETGQAPRNVRGRVAWIQRPRTVRQLFQVALELDLPGNAWGIAFPPEDWFSFPDEARAKTAAVAGAHETVDEEQSALTLTQEIHVPLGEPEAHPTAGTATPKAETIGTSESGPDNLRVFPSVASTTDVSLQLARQVARLLADAKQQINTAAREAASQAVSAERRISFEQWEQKFAEARGQLSSETAHAVERIQEESNSKARAAQAAAAEALQTELPRWLAPQLEQLTRDLTAQLLRAGTAQRAEQTEQLSNATATLRALCIQAEGTAGQLREQAQQSIAQVAAQAEAAAQTVEEAARRSNETAAMERESLSGAANEIQDRVSSALAAAQGSWQSHLARELESAQGRWRSGLESTLASADERAQTLKSELQSEGTQAIAKLRESAASTTTETEQRLTALRDSLQEHSQRLEEARARAVEYAERLDNFSARIESAQQQALGGFQSQLDDVLSLHRNELHRRSESLFEELNARILGEFEESSRRALARFEEQTHSLMQPHLAKTEEAIQRLAGGRSLLEAATTLQQDRIRSTADEAFAESLAHFRENLGSVEQLLHESEQTITARNLTEMEAKASDVKHRAAEELFKTAEWYEKKAQTQIQSFTEKTAEQAVSHLREKAGEVSSLFASELDNSSRNFVAHTQTQMEEVVRDAFARTRELFAEAADTTLAAFTDEIQRHARQELDGVGEEIRKYVDESQRQIETLRTEHFEKISAEQEAFLRRFHTAMSSAMDTEVVEAHQQVRAGLAPLLDSWKSMTERQQAEMSAAYGRMSEQSAEQYHRRLENVSKQWMLATVTTLDHQSREVLNGIAAAAEEKLRETCSRVFAGIGDTLQERLQQIATSFNATMPPSAR
jgi:CRISPR/Cas system CMR-associated protein Cmr5 small subunit